MSIDIPRSVVESSSMQVDIPRLVAFASFILMGILRLATVYLFHVDGCSEISRGRGEGGYALGSDKKRAGKRVGCDSPPC